MQRLGFAVPPYVDLPKVWPRVRRRGGGRDRRQQIVEIQNPQRALLLTGALERRHHRLINSCEAIFFLFTMSRPAGLARYSASRSAGRVPRLGNKYASPFSSSPRASVISTQMSPYLCQRRFLA